MGAPFRPLQPSLVMAEALLNGAPATHAARWRRLAAAVGNHPACTAAVDELLAVSLAGWRVAPVGDGVRVGLVPAPGTAAEELAALQAVVLLVQSTGWSRLKTCSRRGCGRVFLDWTNGETRRACRVHRTHAGRRPRTAAETDDSPADPG